MKARSPHMSYVRRLKRKIDALTGRNYLAELYYRNLLNDAAERSGNRLPVLYPVGAAANYSLLYVIYRAVTDLEIKSVLELGAGQTTLLLDALSKTKKIEVATIETDITWANHIGQKVNHTVHYTQLVDKEIQGKVAPMYKDLTFMQGRRFDLIIVDGPVGSPRHSRRLALEIVEQYGSDDVVVVFDDAERIGEQDTISEYARSLASKEGIEYRYIIGAKAQFISFGSSRAQLKYF